MDLRMKTKSSYNFYHKIRHFPSFFMYLFIISSAVKITIMNILFLYKNMTILLSNGTFIMRFQCETKIIGRKSIVEIIMKLIYCDNITLFSILPHQSTFCYLHVNYLKIFPYI